MTYRFFRDLPRVALLASSVGLVADAWWLFGGHDLTQKDQIIGGLMLAVLLFLWVVSTVLVIGRLVEDRETRPWL